MATLMIPSIISILVACLSFFLNALYTNRKYRKKKDEYLLNNFYNPICSLLTENSRLYSCFGPKTFSEYNMDRRMESGELWESIKTKALIPNLSFIRKILIQHQYFYLNTSAKSAYSDLHLHCLAFALYNDKPNAIYHKFKFNPEWVDIIEQDRKMYIERISK